MRPLWMIRGTYSSQPSPMLCFFSSKWRVPRVFTLFIPLFNTNNYALMKGKENNAEMHSVIDFFLLHSFGIINMPVY